MEQSNAEVQLWRISHAGTCAEQTLPPLAIGFNLRRNVDGQERVVFLRLRLVLVKASKILSARTHIPQLEHIVQRAYDTRHRLTLPDQRTEEPMIWGYAIDKQHRVMAWLGPACSSQEPFAPLIRHWRSGAIMHTVPLPNIHFFDAWRIRPQLTPDPKLGEVVSRAEIDHLWALLDVSARMLGPEATAESTLCGMQIHYGDYNTWNRFPRMIGGS